MITVITDNIGTIIISSVLLLMVAGIILILIKDKKQGKSTCGGNCAHCQMCTACRQADSRQLRR